MAADIEPPRRSALSAQAFELLKVVFTLVLTGVIGGGITYYYQNRSHREQQAAQELETARQSALSFLREVGDILEQRRHHAARVVYAVRDNAPPAEREQAWKDYTNAVNAWNTKWNLYRALVLEQFGPDMQKRFYDPDADSGAVWEKFSITGKLISLDAMLTEYQRQNPENAPPDPNQIVQRYSSLTQDCYTFYSEVIARIQEGRVGRRSWVESASAAAR
ncbi:MAG TPA: hypothetical protein VJ719_03615 [Chthoniobacterales bacterium]|nr:hypothetical protein [Chthoniobacterales bacterium]